MTKTFTVFCWNVGDQLPSTTIPEKIISQQIRANNAKIIVLQEAIRPIAGINKYKHSTKKQPTSWNDNITRSTYPILQHGELTINPRSRTEKYERVSWAIIHIHGTNVCVYNCHLPISGVGIKERIACINKVFAHASRKGLPSIICGDMNTTIPKSGITRRLTQLKHKESSSSMTYKGKYWTPDERYAFTHNATAHGFKEILDITTPTWALPHTNWELFRLKLDWFLVRGLDATVISAGPYLSDHRSFLVACTIRRTMKKSKRTPTQ